MGYDIYIPETLNFQTYIAIIQTARSWADGYDLKDPARLRASLAPEIVVDYSLIVPAWGEKKYTGDAFTAEWLSEEHLGLKPLATQHLIAQPYFKRVNTDEIVVQWQQIAAHGRREGDVKDASAKITEISDGHSYMEHQFVKVDGLWKIARITPSLLYQTGEFMRIRRPEGAQ